MYSYSLYGLRVSSELEINGISEEQFPSHDVFVELADDGSREEPPESFDIHIFWPDIGQFRIRDGSKISVVLAEDYDRRDFRNVLLGTCLATLLYQQGFTVIHGSVVSANNRATAFIGSKGAGKSTTLAGLIAAGRRFVADDILAVGFEDGRPFAIPAFPLAKLEPHWVNHSFPGEPAKNPETGRGKYYYDVSEVFDPEPVPISSINVLDTDGSDGVETEVMTGHEAVMTLIKHAWPTRLRASSAVSERIGDDGPNVDRYGEVAENSQIRRLSVNRSHESLAELGRDLEAVL